MICLAIHNHTSCEIRAVSCFLHASIESDNLVQSADQKISEDGASQFLKFRVNFQIFHALFSTRLSQLG
jgi:hypothetical protein